MGNCTLIIAFALFCIRPNAGMGAPIVLIHYGLKNLITVSYIIMITNTNIISMCCLLLLPFSRQFILYLPCVRLFSSLQVMECW